MRAVASVVLCVFLAGCGNLGIGSNFDGVGTPAPATLANFSTQTVNDSGSLTPGEYLIASVSYTNEKCHDFFDSLEASKQDSAFLDRALKALSQASTALIDPSSSGKTLKAVTQGFNLLTGINDISTEIYTFSAYKDQLKRHVFQQMAAYQKTKGLDLLQQYNIGLYSVDEKNSVTINKMSVKIDRQRVLAFLNDRTPTRLMIARSVAADYASLCSLSNMREIVSHALDSTTSGVSGNSSLSSPVAGSTDAKEPVQQ